MPIDENAIFEHNDLIKLCYLIFIFYNYAKFCL